VSLDAVRAAVALVLADFGHPEVEVPVDLDDYSLVRLSHPDDGTASTRLEVESAAELLVRLADHLQNDANFWLPGTWGNHCHPAPATSIR
jgi:hypothetical protein